MVFKYFRSVLFAVALGASAHAASIERPLADSAQEQTARTIFRELKCVVCEGQSLAESDAELARQMRAHIRTMVKDGKNEAEVLAYFRARYGEHILLTPPVENDTLLLWLAPILLLLGGATLIWHSTRHSGASV